MNKILVLFLSFLLNSSFAEDLSCCPCCYNDYFNDYEEGNDFAKSGLDVYVIDDFKTKDFFNEYYSSFFDKKVDAPISPKENYNIDNFFKEEDPFEEIHFSSHEKPWYYHIYKKKDNDEENKNLIEALARKMSTKGGNNFNWETEEDEARWFNRFRSKVRHNKNVIIVKLEGPNDSSFKNTIYTFRKFVNMSYRPVPIIFTGNFDYKGFDQKLLEINKDYTKENVEDQNGTITVRGVVDKTQHIDSQECCYIQQKEDFVEKVKAELEKASFYHNFKEREFNGETLNIAIIGLPRSGKSLFTNIILNKLSAKVANDVTSVTQGKTTYFHRYVENIPIQTIDTSGFEPNKENSVDSFIDWLLESIDDPNKKRINDIHIVVYFINATNFPKPENFGGEWEDSAGRKRGNEFYLEDEIKLFKIFKDNKVPVIFAIAQSNSFENGYKYLKKWFGDLALINDLSNYQSNDENWNAEDQWICPKWTRGTLIQLKDDLIDDTYTGKYGLVKLMNIIEELFDKNEEYKKRIPKVFANNHSLYHILDELKKQFKQQQGFNEDVKKAPIFENGEDIIVEEVDKKIPRCLDELHDAYIKSNVFGRMAISAAEKGMINAFAKGEKSYSLFGQKIYFPF